MQIMHHNDGIKAKMIKSSMNTKIYTGMNTKIYTGWGIAALLCYGGKPPYNLKNKKEILQKHIDYSIKR